MVLDTARQYTDIALSRDSISCYKMVLDKSGIVACGINRTIRNPVAN